MNGTRATPTWVEGEYLVDAYPVPIKPDAAPGQYQIEIGWYDASDPTFARLQAMDASGNSVGDAVILSTKVEVK